MALENKLGLYGIELVRAEEQISKRRAKQLYDGLTDRIDDRELFMHSIDASYGYEGYTAFRTENI